MQPSFNCTDACDLYEVTFLSLSLASSNFSHASLQLTLNPGSRALSPLISNLPFLQVSFPVARFRCIQDSRKSTIGSFSKTRARQPQPKQFKVDRDELCKRLGASKVTTMLEHHLRRPRKRPDGKQHNLTRLRTCRFASNSFFCPYMHDISLVIKPTGPLIPLNDYQVLSDVLLVDQLPL